MHEIVETGKCVGCAACVTICPTDVFGHVDECPTDDRVTAFTTAVEFDRDGLVPTGLLFLGDTDLGDTDQPNDAAADKACPPALLDIEPAHHLNAYREVMRSFMEQ